MSVTQLRQFVESEETDQALEARLSALETAIRAYTNNSFQARAFRAVAVAMSDGNALIVNSAVPFKPGDTLQISESDLQPGALVTIEAVEDGTIIVREDLFDESGVVITKVSYPADIKMGVVNLMKWELENRDKVGVSSETISRHSVTYFNMDGDNAMMGYPKSLMGFLRPYRKARFGKGVSV